MDIKAKVIRPLAFSHNVITYRACVFTMRSLYFHRYFDLFPNLALSLTSLDETRSQIVSCRLSKPVDGFIKKGIAKTRQRGKRAFAYM